MVKERVGTDNGLYRRQAARHGPVMVRAAVFGMDAALGFLTSSALIFGGCGPFGTGMVAQAGPGLDGLLCLLGAAAGYLLTFGLGRGVKYVAAAMIVFTVAFVFQELRLYRMRWFMPLIACVTTLITGMLGGLSTFSGETEFYKIAAESVLAGGSTYFFRIALSGEERTTEGAQIRHSVSVMILLGCVLIAASRLEIINVLSAGRLAAVLLVMAAAYRGGFMPGSAVGAAMGLAMDMASGAPPFYTMAYAFSGLLSGVLMKQGRLLFVIGYITANTVAVVWAQAGPSALFEIFAASVIFIILPSGAISRIGDMMQPSSAGSGEAGLRKYTAGRMKIMGESFRGLYEAVRGNVESEQNDNDVARVFDRAADAVCAACRGRDRCWQSDYVDTISAMNDATGAMLERGRLILSDLPQHFTDSCCRADALVSAVNAELRGLMYRRQFKSCLSENRSAAYGQYADMADIMDELATELGSSGGPDPFAERRLLRCLRGMDVDAGVSVFRDGSGRMRAVIDSGRIQALMRTDGWLDRISAAIGTRLCCPNAQEGNGERLVLLEAEPLAASVGIAAMKKQGEPVSGDRGTYFKTDRGILCVILSDGMGSGEDAAKESVCAVDMLEGFLRSGVDPRVAMKMLNSVMLLKNGEEWGYAAIDLMCIDLFSGETCFYKYGAAPSYVKSGRTIRRVRGESMAAGACAGEGASPDIVRMKLKPGSVAVVASDGVIAEEDDGWLKSILGEYSGSDTKTLAKQTLQAAVREFGCQDDMTVLAVQVSERT